MSTQTTNLKLNKPDIGDTPGVTIPQLASNFDILDASLTDISINWNKYNFVGDYSYSTSIGTDNLNALKQLINDNPNGGRVYVPPGNYYISDENQLPNTIQNFEFIGISNVSIMTFGKVCGTSTATAPTSNTVPNWMQCKFRNITFSAPSATGYAIFTSGSSNLKFYHCTISDVKPLFQQSTGDVCIFHDCKFIAPNTAAGTCLQTIGNVTSRFIVEECEWNFAPNQGAGSLIAATNASNLVGDYWFLNNRVFTDQQAGYAIDAFVDLEPNNATTPLRNIFVEGNVVYNAKMYIGGVSDLRVKGNHFHMTSIAANTSIPASAVIQGTEAYSTAPIKYIEIIDNTIICDDVATYNYKMPIRFNENNTIERLVIRGNTLQANGQQNSDNHTVIDLNSANGAINHLKIEDNHLSYTSVPSSGLEGAIYLVGNGTGTFNHVRIKRNTLAGVAGACSYFIHETNGGTNMTIDELIIVDNDVRAGAPSSGFLAGSPNTLNVYTVKDNIGYNPVGSLSSPGFAGTGIAVKNTFGCPVRVYIPSGTSITQIAINGVNTGMTTGEFLLQPNETITPTYSAGASWTWVGM